MAALSLYAFFTKSGRGFQPADACASINPFHYCRTVGKSIAHCAFHITHCLAGRNGPTAFPLPNRGKKHCPFRIPHYTLSRREEWPHSFSLPINAQCVMRNGQ